MEQLTSGIFLVPQMCTFNGTNPKLVVIMDTGNCSIHHVSEAFFGCSHSVLFLPPFCPDFSPIEEAFSFVEKT